MNFILKINLVKIRYEATKNNNIKLIKYIKINNLENKCLQQDIYTKSGKDKKQQKLNF